MTETPKIKKRTYFYTGSATPTPQEFTVYSDGERITVEDPQTKNTGEVTRNPYGWYDWQAGKKGGPIHGFENAVRDVCLTPY